MTASTVDRTLSLASGVVDLWFARPEAADSPRLRRAYEALLDPAEQDQARRFIFERDRRLYLVSHALVRVILSRYAPVAPADWRFTRNQHGRPEVALAGLSALRFNLSHTRGLALCGVTRDLDIGVDVEDASRARRTVDVAERFFAPAEVQALRGLPLAAQRDRFFDYWTLKEAYIKARGMGLALPLSGFAFDLQGQGAISIAIEPRLQDDPAQWQFDCFRPTDTHRAALAVRRGAAASDLELVRRWIVPLESAAG